MTNLVDHYLLQLKSYLPAKRRDDIAAEIGESIRSTVEERERELGRDLGDDELGAVLKGYGHPMLIAGRYLPMQYLIGPTVFPVYWYALQGVTIVIAVIGGLLTGVALLIADDPAQVALQVLGNVFWIGLLACTVVTFVFAVMDHERVRLPFLEGFAPRRRPESGILGVRAAPLSPISRQDTIFEVATTAILLSWWIGWIDFGSVFPEGITVEFARGVESFFWPIVGVCVIELVRLGVDLARPYRTPMRTLWRLGLNVAWLALVVVLYRADDPIEVTSALADTARVERVAWMVDVSLRITLFVLGLITAGLIALDAVRIVRR